MSDIDSWLLFCRTRNMNMDGPYDYGETAECLCARLLDYDDNKQPEQGDITC